MNLRTSSLNLLGMIVLLAGGWGWGCGDDQKNQGDPALVGTWVGTEVEFPPYTWTFVITANTMDVQATSGESYKGTYTLDTTVDPKRVASIITECPLPAYIGKPSNGIYKLEGPALTFASNIPGDETFPTAFIAGTLQQTRVFTLSKQ